MGEVDVEELDDEVSRNLDDVADDNLQDGELADGEDVEEQGEAAASRKALKRKAKAEQRAEWKAAQKAKQKEKRSNKRRKGPPLPPRPEADAQSPEEIKALRAARKSAELDDFRSRSARGCTVVLDLEWEDCMQPKELKSLLQQVLYCYGANRRAPQPSRLVFSGVRDGSQTHAGLSKQSGYEGWEVQKLEGPYIKAFPQERLVYLTADSETVLESFDPEKVYIIGGIVDRNRLKGKTMEKALEQGIATAQLPLAQHIEMGSYSRVLAVNHVLNMILEHQACGDWRAVCKSCVPGRKKMIDSANEEGAEAEAEDVQAEAEAEAEAEVS